MKAMPHRTALLLAMSFLVAGSIPAATFVNFHDFSPFSNNTMNNDGAEPKSDLVSDGTFLYGAADAGGTNGIGTIFAVSLSGGSFVNLHNFDVPTNGQGPSASMALSGAQLYGTTRVGGTNGLGTVFSISTSGAGFNIIHQFGLAITGHDPVTGNGINSGGAFPETDLVLSGGTLYGATEQGGSGGGGVLFKLSTNGLGFTLLHNFNNADGQYPSVHMVVIGTNLFGTTVFGGTGPVSGNGTIFRVNTDGTGFTNLYYFNGTNAANPYTGLVFSGSNLYGMAHIGQAALGGAPYGSIFRIDTNGSNFAIVYVIDPELNAASPTSGLVVSSNQIYGTELGYDYYGDTIFRVNTDGTGYTNLTSFNTPGDPGSINGLSMVAGNLYCTGSGGANSNGDIFELTLSSPVNQHLSFQLKNKSVVLTWVDASLSLYSALTATGPFTIISGATSPYTNAATASQQFFEIK